MDLLTPSSPGGLPTLFLTTNGSWLPWGRVAMPLISPLMPVPQKSNKVHTEEINGYKNDGSYDACIWVAAHVGGHACTYSSNIP